MVTGIPPFYESDESALKNSILHGNYKGYSPDFDKNASKNLHQLMEKMILLNPTDRIDSDGLVLDPWINSAHQRFRQLSRSIVSAAYNNMKSFRIGYQLQRMALMHMAKIYIEYKEKSFLKMIFDALDEEKDGEIELKEFVIQLNEKFDIHVTVPVMEGIMKQIDLDYDGKVQFTEFLIAACDKRKLFTTHNLQLCFEFIDSDGDGEITTADLQEFMGQEVDQYYISNMIEDADDNADGGLQVKEFEAIMLKILKTHERMI